MTISGHPSSSRPASSGAASKAAAAAAALGPVPASATQVLTRENLRPIFYCSIAVLGAILYGYDGTYFTGVLSQDNFNNDFGDWELSAGTNPPATASRFRQLSGSRQSLLTSLVQAGEVFGCLLAGFVGDASGRKGVFASAAGFVAVGAIMQMATTGNLGLFATGRAFLGLGIGQVANSTPLYLSEIAPTALRGIAVSSWQLLLAIGQVVGAGVNNATKDYPSTASYRIPIGVNLIICLLIWLGLLILPESPRWLVSRGKDEQAVKSLRKIYKNASRVNAKAAADTDASAPAVASLTDEDIVQRELALFKRAHDDEVATSSQGGWSSLFSNPVERRKLACTFGILAGQQISGVQFIFSYTTTFLGAVGVSDPFLITIIVDVVEVVGVICSLLIINRFGRRPLLLSTSVPMFASLFIVGGLGTVPDAERTEAQKRTIAAMICIYVFFFNLSWGGLAWTIAAELSHGINKSKIMAVGTTAFFTVAFVVTFTLPYLFNAEYAGLGAQIGWIYGALALVAMAFVYFYIPETLGRSLEEINEMLQRRVPARAWGQVHSYGYNGEASPSDDAAAFPPSSQGIIGEEQLAAKGEQDVDVKSDELSKGDDAKEDTAVTDAAAPASAGLRTDVRDA